MFAQMKPLLQVYALVISRKYILMTCNTIDTIQKCIQCQKYNPPTHHHY